MWRGGLSCHLRCWHPTWVPAGVPAAPFLIQLPVNAAEKAEDAPCGEIQMDWVVPGPASAVVAIWGANQQMGDLSLSLSFK